MISIFLTILVFCMKARFSVYNQSTNQPTRPTDNAVSLQLIIDYSVRSLNTNVSKKYINYDNLRSALATQLKTASNFFIKILTNALQDCTGLKNVT